jgi:hypothetical protein
MSDPASKNGLEKAQSKPTYRRPHLAKYGSISELTTSGSGFRIENAFGMGMGMGMGAGMMRRP